MICTQVTQISHSTVGSSFSVSFSADTSELDLLNMMHKWFREWNMSGIGFAKIEPQNMASYIIEAYSRGYTDGADAVKAIKDEPQTVVDWKDEMWAEAREQLEKCLADKDEPTISKMEQVNELTTDDKCFECDDFFACGGQCNKSKDEPQTEREGER